MDPTNVGWYRHQTKSIGTITPSANIVVERVTNAILRDFLEVSAHFSRIPVFGNNQAYDHDYDWDGMMSTARLLSHAQLDVICWNGSKGASIGFEPDYKVCDRITAETGIPATTSIVALDLVLKKTGVRRIGLVSPHTDEYQLRVTTAFEERGYLCAAEVHAGLDDNFSYCRVPDTEIIQMVRTVATAKPDAIVTFCTNFPAAHLVEPLERETGIPIYDTTSIGVWAALQTAGVPTQRGARWGSLFSSSLHEGL